MRWLPRTLAGRVFALCAAVLAGIALCTLALLLGLEVRQQMAGARADGQAVAALLLPVLADSAVIGDYDTIDRALARAADHSAIRAAEFTDAKGGHLRSVDSRSADGAPEGLRAWVGAELGTVEQPVAAGGTRYGQLRLVLAADVIAASIWRQAWWGIGIAAAGLSIGLLLIGRPLRRWLGHLDKFSALGDELEGAQRLADRALAGDVPAEFRRTFELLGRAASHLQMQREQAAVTLQAIGDAVLTADVEGRVLLANDAAQRLLQRPADSLLGQSLSALLPGVAGRSDGSAHDGDRPPGGPQAWTAPDGTERVLEATLSPILDPDGQRIGQVLACRDITGQHRRDQALRALHAARDHALAALRQVLERTQDAASSTPASGGDLEVVSTLVSRLVAQLQERNARLDAIFALSPDGFVSFDGERRVRYASPGFVRLTSLSSDMVVGLEEAVFLRRLRSRCTQPDSLPTLEPGAGQDMRTVELAGKPPRRLALSLHRAASSVGCQVLHLRDVTRESELDRMKSEFVVAAAHELRTPLSAIYGFAELLMAREMPPEKQRMLLARIHRQCEVVVALVDQLLDLARLESAQGADFEWQPAALDTVVAAALADADAPAGRPAARYRPAAGDWGVRVDVARLQRAVQQLLSNAYKYSAGDSEVRVDLVRDDAGGRVGVAIEDRGIGLTAEQLARLGERFYRADTSGSLLGAGLGVSLARETVQLLGGSLAYRSEPGQGTVATLWLPAHGAGAAVSAAG